MLTYKIDVLKKLEEMGYPQPTLRNRRLLGQNTIQQLRSGKMVGTIVLDKICQLTKLQPGDIIQYVEDAAKTRMDQATYECLRTVRTTEDLPTGAAFYSMEYERWGRNHFSWYRIYDKNFDPIENVKVLYTNSLTGLRRIVHEDSKDDMAMQAYKLEKASDKYYYVIETDATTEILTAMCNSVKPGRW